jgi:WD40 repeat protein
MTQEAELEWHIDYVLSVCISPDGRWLASGSLDKSVGIWDIKTKSKVTAFTDHTYAVIIEIG